MNKQGKVVNGKVIGGIEWTKTIRPDGTEYPGYTWNPIGGCFHGCQWVMPDGKVANCYAEDVAEGVARAAYPQGFEHHYWNPRLLAAPLSVKTPSKVFVGSMADVFGHWVPDEQIATVLGICTAAHWHTFQFLTKNPRRAARFNLPPNVWLGASSPPDYMWGKRLTNNQQLNLMHRSLDALGHSNARVKWMSFEPLTNGWYDTMYRRRGIVQWAVIGAASNGKTYYAPNGILVSSLVKVFDKLGVPVFFKGNMRSLPWAAQNWREEFPV